MANDRTVCFRRSIGRDDSPNATIALLQHASIAKYIAMGGAQWTIYFSFSVFSGGCAVGSQ
eukprot:2323148-Lingulodinium_polyedra.AAC.1